MSKESKTYKNSPKKVYIRTFGCQMNKRDSEILAGLLQEKGYTLAESYQNADIVLFNTCAVRRHAEMRAINSLRSIAKGIKKRGFKDSRICFMV